jgi:LysM repeat protein
VKRATSLVLTVVIFLIGIVLGSLRPVLTPPSVAPNGRRAAIATNTRIADLAQGAVAQAATSASQPPPTETIPPFTPLASLTPSKTLRPPPTFEPPTQTPLPTTIPTETMTATIDLRVSLPGLRGAESPTPVSTAGCVVRKDWKQTYTVQFNDALSRIADKYGVTADDLATANCLPNKNLIQQGQVLKVPGSAPLNPNAIECRGYELLAPFDGTLSVEGGGTLSIVWVGPRAPRNLIRIFRPDGSKHEVVVELRQSEQINMPEFLAQAGTYTWYIYPLDGNFQQACPEGGPWRFTKALSPTLTPSPTPR